MKGNITKQQINILIMAVAAVLSVALFFIFIYAPKQAQIRRLNQEFQDIEKSLTNIEVVIGGKRDFGKGILRLKAKARSLDLKFINPDNIAEVLKLLSQQARRMKLEIISMQPSEFQRAEGLKCDKGSIDMNVIGTYQQLADYMQAVEERDTPLFIIRKFDVYKYQIVPRLKAHITVDVFALPRAENTGRQ